MPGLNGRAREDTAMKHQRVSEYHRDNHRDAMSRARAARANAKHHARLLREAAAHRLYFLAHRSLGD
jgi:hypothetical protein